MLDDALAPQPWLAELWDTVTIAPDSGTRPDAMR
jgi:hypothetical protein